MTDQPAGLWRPAVPKKPADVKITSVTTSAPVPLQSAALRGATQAFVSKPLPRDVRQKATESLGARAAAAVARDNSHPASVVRSNTGSDILNTRGRQLTGTPSLPAGEVQRDLQAPLQKATGARSPSEIAARFASAGSSPIRGNSDNSSPRRSPIRSSTQSSPVRHESMIKSGPGIAARSASKSITERKKVLPPPKSRPVLVSSNSQPILDFDRGRRLPAPLSDPVKPVNASTINASTAAAQAAAKASPVSSPPWLPSRNFPSGSMTPGKSTLVSPVADFESSSFLQPILSNSTAVTDDTTGPESPPGVPSQSTQSIPRSMPIPIKNGSPPKVSSKPIPSSSSGQRKGLRTGMTEQTMADAIVASSLASTRVGSPAKHDRAPPPPRRSRSHSILHRRHHESLPDPVFKPTPIRPMKHTLRKQSKAEDDEEDVGIIKRGRHHHFRKHPNKHHEGDRKRWRDKITERERKRYEGVWAANRGLFSFWDSVGTPFGGTYKASANADMVVNVVVRDIWERSRLPKDALEEIWDLVAQDEAMALKRDEFVVGLWLIDQRLKGRKLPTRVSQSVWASVRHTQGLKISRKPL